MSRAQTLGDYLHDCSDQVSSSPPSPAESLNQSQKRHNPRPVSRTHPWVCGGTDSLSVGSSHSPELGLSLHCLDAVIQAVVKVRTSPRACGILGPAPTPQPPDFPSAFPLEHQPFLCPRKDAAQRETRCFVFLKPLSLRPSKALVYFIDSPLGHNLRCAPNSQLLISGAFLALLLTELGLG